MGVLIKEEMALRGDPRHITAQEDECSIEGQSIPEHRKKQRTTQSK